MRARSIRRAALVAGLIVLASSLARAAGGVTTDGFWWNDLSNDAKRDIMAAAISAYQAGWRNGATAAAAHKGNGAVSGPAFDGQPVTVYVNRMNQFYAENTDVTTIDTAAVLPCLQDKPPLTCAAIADLYRKVNAPAK